MPLREGNDSNANAFWKYTISTNTWTVLANTPAPICDTAGLATVGSDAIYAFGKWGLMSFGNTQFPPISGLMLLLLRTDWQAEVILSLLVMIQSMLLAGIREILSINILFQQILGAVCRLLLAQFQQAGL